jgi:hypothetical protein
MELSTEQTEATFLLPMSGKPTEQMTPMKPATSPAALSHHFIYLAVPSTRDGQLQFIAFSSTNFTG